MGVIKTLKQFVTGKQIYPVTKSNAVYDDIAGRLDTLLQKYVGESETLDTTGELPRDADTLGGKTAEQYQAEINALVAKNNELQNNLNNYKSGELKVVGGGVGCEILYNEHEAYLSINIQGLNLTGGNVDTNRQIVLPPNVDIYSSMFISVNILNSGYTPTNNNATVAINQDSDVVTIRCVSTVTNAVIFAPFIPIPRGNIKIV